MHLHGMTVVYRPQSSTNFNAVNWIKDVVYAVWFLTSSTVEHDQRSLVEYVLRRRS